MSDDKEGNEIYWYFLCDIYYGFPIQSVKFLFLGNSVNLLERLQGAFNAPTQQNPIMSNPPQGNPTQTPPMRTHMPPQGIFFLTD